MDTDRPDIARAFAHLVGLLDFSALSAMEDIVAAARAAMEKYGDVLPRTLLTGLVQQPAQIGALAGEWLFPPEAPQDTRILYLHGGGMLTGSLASHRAIAAELARQSGLAVLTIAYRLAPEHVFPAGHDDCAAAWAFIQDNGPHGAAPARQLFLAGDSAGGTLAAATCARMIAQRNRVPDALALLGPCLDNRDAPQRADSAGDPIINNAMVGGIALYAAATARDHPALSPLLLDDAVLAQFPPALLQAGSGEYLLADSQALAARLTALGRRNCLSIWPDMPHVWHLFQTLLPEARAAMAEIAAFFHATPKR